LEPGTTWPSSLPGSGRTPQYYLDEPLNGKEFVGDTGKAAFRGCNTMIRAVQYGRVKNEGIVNHVMELFQGPPTASAGRWPMTGFEDKGGTIPEGTRLRIKPLSKGVNVESILATDTAYYGQPTSRTAAQAAAFQEAVAIAKGMQKYGVIVADNSGQGTKIKLGSTAKLGLGQQWQVNIDGLRKLPFATHWEVIQDHYDPPDVT
jgi:hypothetical protein